MSGGKKELTFIDLFAGAGGLAEGFIRAGYKPIAYVEFDKNACFTLKTRLTYYYLKNKNLEYVYESYLKNEITRDELYSIVPDEIIGTVINEKISEDSLNDIFLKVDDLLATKKKKQVDVIIGGPPCQAYSLVGRKRNEPKKDNDERIYLYKLYARFLRKYKPEIFVFENVQGLKSFEKGNLFPELIKYFVDEGYKVDDRLLNAADFGVLQNRKRIFLFGYKKHLKIKLPEFSRIEHNSNVQDIFLDLPAAKYSFQKGFVRYKNKGSEYLTKFEIRNGYDFTVQHTTRRNNDVDKEIYRIAITLWNDKKQRLKYSDLREDLINHNNKKSFLDRFKVVAKELENSHTLVAHIAKDGHYYIHPSLKQIRSISVREAARIQSFPDDYFFESSRTSAFTQIGNAVPPLMAHLLASKIMGLI